jgi:hypothetical protein
MCLTSEKREREKRAGVVKSSRWLSMGSSKKKRGKKKRSTKAVVSRFVPTFPACALPTVASATKKGKKNNRVLSLRLELRFQDDSTRFNSQNGPGREEKGEDEEKSKGVLDPSTFQPLSSHFPLTNHQGNDFFSESCVLTN